MKIGAFLDQKIDAGGGFQQSLNAAIQMKKICEGCYDFCVYTSVKSNLTILDELGLPSYHLPDNFWGKLYTVANLSRILQRSVWGLRIASRFEQRLQKDGVDLVYFLTPSGKASKLQSLNYIFTVFDLCHRDFPEFPEVRDFGTFEKRELLFSFSLGKAYLVLADSDELKRGIQRCYGIDPGRILVMPYQPAVDCTTYVQEITDKEILDHYNLDPGYLFYPAQFWSHKGHVRLLEALEIFRDRNGNVPLCVFAGGDHGNLAVVSERIKQKDLANSIRILGFVPNEHIPVLYRSAAALVMPTYFGPTNLPPLEAMALGVPVIYPEHLKKPYGDAVVSFDVDDPQSLCDAIEYTLNKLNKNVWLKIAEQRTRIIFDEIAQAEHELLKKLEQFKVRSRCWSTKN